MAEDRTRCIAVVRGERTKGRNGSVFANEGSLPERERKFVTGNPKLPVLCGVLPRPLPQIDERSRKKASPWQDSLENYLSSVLLIGGLIPRRIGEVSVVVGRQMPRQTR